MAKQYPTAEGFEDAIDELSYQLAIEMLTMQTVHHNVEMTRGRMREMLTKFGDEKYDEGVEVGLKLGQQFSA